MSIHDVDQQMSPTERIGVVAHGEKSLDTDVKGLRRALDERGVEPRVVVVPKAKLVHERLEAMLDDGVDRLLVWGGDGTTRRCIHTLVECDVHDVAIGVLPAGTANLLARNLHVPLHLDAALDIALGSTVTAIDIGTIGDAHFAVSCGTGFGSDLIRANDRGKLKPVLRQLSHLWYAFRLLPAEISEGTVTVDDRVMHDGAVSAVMVANVGETLGRIRAFPDADPADGILDVGIVRARTRRQWVRLAQSLRRGEDPPAELALRTTGTSVGIELDRPRRWQVDGSDRQPERSFTIGVLARRQLVCVPDVARGIPGTQAASG